MKSAGKLLWQETDARSVTVVRPDRSPDHESLHGRELLQKKSMAGCMPVKQGLPCLQIYALWQSPVSTRQWPCFAQVLMLRCLVVSLMCIFALTRLWSVKCRFHIC